MSENLSRCPICKKNFIRNTKLISFDSIPDEIREASIRAYNEYQNEYDPNRIFEFLSKHKLNELINNINDFYLADEIKKLEEEFKNSFSNWVK